MCVKTTVPWSSWLLILRRSRQINCNLRLPPSLNHSKPLSHLSCDCPTSSIFSSVSWRVHKVDLHVIFAVTLWREKVEIESVDFFICNASHPGWGLHLKLGKLLFIWCQSMVIRVLENGVQLRNYNYCITMSFIEICSSNGGTITSRYWYELKKSKIYEIKVCCGPNLLRAQSSTPLTSK